MLMTRSVESANAAETLRTTAARMAISRRLVASARRPAASPNGAIPAIQRRGSEAAFTPASTPAATASIQERLRASTTRYAAKTAAVKGVEVWKLTVSSDVSAFGPTTIAAAAAVTPAHLPATRHVAQPTSVNAPRAKTYPVASHTRS